MKKMIVLGLMVFIVLVSSGCAEGNGNVMIKEESFPSYYKPATVTYYQDHVILRFEPKYKVRYKDYVVTITNEKEEEVSVREGRCSKRSCSERYTYAELAAGELQGVANVKGFDPISFKVHIPQTEEN